MNVLDYPINVRISILKINENILMQWKISGFTELTFYMKLMNIIINFHLV